MSRGTGNVCKLCDYDYVTKNPFLNLCTLTRRIRMDIQNSRNNMCYAIYSNVYYVICKICNVYSICIYVSMHMFLSVSDSVVEEKGYFVRTMYVWRVCAKPK